MPAYTQIVREMSEAKFQEVFGVSIRKARETYLARHNIKAPKSVKKSLRAGAKNEARVVALFCTPENGGRRPNGRRDSSNMAALTSGYPGRSARLS